MSWELKLNAAVTEDVYIWINHILLVKSKRKLARDFSDGVLAAEVIQYYLPDMVSMNDYLPNSAIGQKKINWGVLNRKVLSQLGLHLPDTIIRDLSHAKPGTIERFLFNLRLKIDEEIESRHKPQSQDTSSPQESSVSLNHDFSINDDKPVLSKRISRPIVNLRDKWVPRLDYEDLKQQSLQKQEEVEILQARLRRFEHVVRLKELRIAELSSTVEEFRQFRPNKLSIAKDTKK